MQYIANSNGLYDVINNCGHAACNQYLSAGQDCGNTLVDMYTQDDGSGRQQWQVRLGLFSFFPVCISKAETLQSVRGALKLQTGPLVRIMSCRDRVVDYHCQDNSSGRQQ